MESAYTDCNRSFGLHHHPKGRGSSFARLISRKSGSTMDMALSHSNSARIPMASMVLPPTTSKDVKVTMRFVAATRSMTSRFATSRSRCACNSGASQSGTLSKLGQGSSLVKNALASGL